MTVRIEMVPLSELKTAGRNPKMHATGDIRKSIGRFGFVAPIVIDERTGRMAAGHGRLEALLSMKAGGEKPPERVIEKDGEWLVPVVRGVRFNSDEEAEAYLLADNRLTELGGWDEKQLTELLAELQIKGVDALDGIGYSEKDIAKLAARYGEETEQDDFKPRVEPKYDIQRGQIWILGEHRLMCGDSVERGDVKKLMGERRTDIVITDPPYNVNYSSKNELLNLMDNGKRIQKEIVIDNLFQPGEYSNFTNKWLGNLLETVADTNSIYIHGNYETVVPMYQIEGLKISNILVWMKNSIVLGRQDYKGQHEFIIYGWKGRHQWYGPDNESTVIQINKTLKNDLHPTMKPIELLARFLRNSSKEGDVCLDLFGGSGSTLIACEQLNRRCLVMEIDPYYCSVIIERWEQFTGKKAEMS